MKIYNNSSGLLRETFIFGIFFFYIYFIYIYIFCYIIMRGGGKDRETREKKCFIVEDFTNSIQETFLSFSLNHGFKD